MVTLEARDEFGGWGGCRGGGSGAVNLNMVFFLFFFFNLGEIGKGSVVNESSLIIIHIWDKTQLGCFWLQAKSGQLPRKCDLISSKALQLSQ